MKNNKLKAILSIITCFMLLFSLTVSVAGATGESSSKAKQSRATNYIYDSSIDGIYVGDSAYGNTWEYIEIGSGSGGYTVTLPTDKKYVKIVTRRWGMPHTSQYWSMDGQKPVTSSITGYFNENGNACSPGAIVYGVQEATVWEIPATVPSSQIRIVLYSNNGDKQMICNITWEGNGGEGPTTVSLGNENADAVKLNGADNTMEYKVGNAKWVKCEANQIIPVGETGISVDVRYAATSDKRASDPVTFTMQRGQAPILTYNEDEEVIYGVDSNMEYRVDSGAYVGITGNTLSVADLITPNPTTFYIRYKGNNGLASCDWSATAYPIPAAPTTPRYELTTYYHELKGIDSSMELRINYTGSWNSYNSTSLSFNNIVSDTQETFIEVRYKATADKPASAIKLVTIPKAYRPASGAYLSGSYMKGLKAGIPYELVYSNRFTSPKTYKGVVDSTGKIDLPIITVGPGMYATYKLRYRSYGDISASPWIELNV